ncbi:MAG: hypothetical protein ACRD6W_01450 [Nitrososphaerales archaeon]
MVLVAVDVDFQRREDFAAFILKFREQAVAFGYELELREFRKEPRVSSRPSNASAESKWTEGGKEP